ncbi:hypothetical protein K7887_18685 [Sutcliffiella horikoshii]|uniref:hypothetical protein n=1 Tax=Sutcliffiella horikoshii TaxID=79883 RepID=UPI001CBC1BC7|nr:hypothetical protein [Sutcliffiella horikoshii]UAL46867.1 hypothetical protein K7887_18685 [Sutcliffiella horikoshii]
MKRLFALFLIGVLVSGCSNTENHQEKVTELENEIAEVYAQLEEKEMEIETLSQPSMEEETGEFITIPKDQVPLLWRDVDAQLWDYLINDSLAEENGWEKGITNWREWDGEYDQALGSANQTWESPGVLMNAWMLDVGLSNGLGMDVWEINTRIDFSDEAIAEGYIMSYGMRDDSVSGSDIKLSMLKENDFWYVEKAEVRFRCSRGVSEDDLCL